MVMRRQCHVSDLDILLYTSFIFLHHLNSDYVMLYLTKFAFRLATVRISHIFLDEVTGSYMKLYG